MATVASVHVLHVKDSGGAERTIPLGAEPLVFGRDEDCSVPLDSPFVSRRHARIEPGPDGPLLVDLESHNGTSVNGESIDQCRVLRVGDVITLGDVTVECLAGIQRLVKTRTLVRPSVRLPASVSHQTQTLNASPETPAPLAAEEHLRLDPRTLQVWIGDRPVQKRLSVQEFKLLSYLYEHRDRICSRQELGNAIWGRYTWDPNLLYRLVRRLKEKIEPDPQKPRFLQTVPWVGYRLTP